MNRVLVCGGRTYVDRARLFTVLGEIIGYAGHPDSPRLVVIHGGAAGADKLAGDFADYAGHRVEVYKADWEKHGKSAGPIRNQQMLDEGKPDLVIAFPGGAGTADMVRRARKAGIRVREIPPCP